jgi:hypothetical protein
LCKARITAIISEESSFRAVLLGMAGVYIDRVNCLAKFEGVCGAVT